MGNAPPTTLSEEERLSLQGTALPACRRAADAIKSADVLLVCVGDGLGAACSANSADAGWPHQPQTQNTTATSNTDPAHFFGVWGRRFNKSRSASPREAYGVLQRWLDAHFSGTEVAEALVRAGGGSVEDSAEKKADGTWKQAAFTASGGKGSEMLVLDDSACPASTHVDDEDEEALERMPIDAHAPDLPGAFHIFTSCVDGHASRIFGAHCVRECRGSLQLWQCGASAGPCRQSDVWEAPSGFTFRLRSGAGDDDGDDADADADADEDEDEDEDEGSSVSDGDDAAATEAPGGSIVAPAGQPASKPPVHLVPMWKPQCMDGALSVAAAFSTNHPVCRTCNRTFARPALQLGGDCNWTDVEERRGRYARWKACVQEEAAARRANQTHSWAGGGKRPLRVVVLEVGSSFSHPTPQQEAGSLSSQTEVSGAVRQESETFVAALNGSGGGAVATLVRISEDFPLPERTAAEGLAPSAVIPILMPTDEALKTIDSELSRLAAAGAI